MTQTRNTTRVWIVTLAALIAMLGELFTVSTAHAALPSWPNIGQGASGPQVSTIQYLLRDHGHSLAADGAFGPITASAVESFQSSNGLTSDGIVGPQTWPELIVQLSQGASGEAVKALQTQLNRHGHGLAIDGAFGPATNSAVRSFQSSHPDLSTDGVAGPRTWQALVGGSGGGGGGDFSLPIPRSTLPRSEYDDPHHDYPAIDLPVGTGTPAYAVRSGRVTIINDSRCGRGINLTGDDGAIYTYCHFSAWSVSAGQYVSAGQRIGSTGNTGNSTGPHLHFGIRTGSTRRCPQPFLLAIYDGRTPPSAGSLPTSGCSY